ncbi:MAG: 1,4-alpha-glucan branching protein GlgB, partial [Bacteroides sp.]
MTKKLYKMMNWPVIEEIIYSESQDPHATLGPHVQGNGTLIQAFFPGAQKATLQLTKDMTEKEMELADDDGFFAVWLPVKNVGAYRYIVSYENGSVETMQDAYRHECLITAEDEEKFAMGVHYTVYEKLGAHPLNLDGEDGVYFAVWAPNALRVSTVGDFNHWDGRVHQMRKLPSGIFEIFIPGVKAGDNYKYEIKLKTGLTYLKADPYGNAAQLRPETASVVADLRNFKWEDKEFIKKRKTFRKENAPISVYELYLGSFLAPKDDEEYANYREIADKLIPYVKEMGYTHVELMPVMEHPLDASWGYQVIGYYAPTARYGTPEDFMYFVNELHKAGIGVILDWVPAHFPRDIYGLSSFDGTCLYENPDEQRRSHPHWGTLVFDYGRPEVSNYLIANALFWVEKFHADGIRMDAVASMLYLDYGRNPGEWTANIYGGNENLEAVELIKHLNSMMGKRNPGVLRIAEESTAWPMVTGSLEDGGLGFDLKWNMGWMNDYLDYIKYDPYFRSHHHSELTFSMIYAYSEKFMLVFSHDEAVHGKSSMLGKMPGEREQKFANLRLTYAYMFTHPGRKLLFMGQDIGEFSEWNEMRQTEWELLKYPDHKGMAALVKKLNELYTTKPALYEWDDKPEGFAWINSINSTENLLTFLRKTRKKESLLVVAANFSGVEKQVKIGVPYEGSYKEILNTDAEGQRRSIWTHSNTKSRYKRRGLRW